MEFENFTPEYPGDTPNRKWVRDKAAEKGIKVDPRDVIKEAPDSLVRWLFKQIMQVEYPEHYNRETGK